MDHIEAAIQADEEARQEAEEDLDLESLIPETFEKLKKARAKLKTVDEQFRKAHSGIEEDRHKWAGKIYEHQNQVNTLVDELIDLVQRLEAQD